MSSYWSDHTSVMEDDDSRSDIKSTHLRHAESNTSVELKFDVDALELDKLLKAKST